MERHTGERRGIKTRLGLRRERLDQKIVERIDSTPRKLLKVKERKLIRMSPDEIRDKKIEAIYDQSFEKSSIIATLRRRRQRGAVGRYRERELQREIAS